MNKMGKKYEAPAIYEEVIDERDIITSSAEETGKDNDVNIGQIIF